MLADRLRLLRAQENKTQKQVADYLGITRPAYTAYEKGNRTPDYELLAKIADYFAVTTDYLLGRSDDPAPAKHVQAGIPDDKYQALSPYQQEVLDFMLNSETLAFHDQPDDLLEALEDFEVYYEVWKKRKERDKK